MKLKDVKTKLQSEGFVDENGLFAYGQEKTSEGAIAQAFGGSAGGIVAGVAGLRLLAICGDKLNILKAKLNNDYVSLPKTLELSQISAFKAGFGFLWLQRKIKFMYKGVKFKYVFNLVGSKPLIAKLKQLCAENQ